ncbi:DUF1003 domain-containing protein [Paracoccus luteus]|uniref:DUF1003 domain-containing protein n=1 Tax=Paracoccus luteus TaxID=2508543 RepID=UPI00143103AE|nr:DUF1003 domain-containing protein [Paracoccus luteus]
MPITPLPPEMIRDWLAQLQGHISPAEHRVLEHLLTRKPIARDLHLGGPGASTLGGRMADRVASFGGSWSFIAIFTAVLLLWVAGNAMLAARAFDPYPFIFLNLILSMLAAFQAPIIMMSQNRQAAKDRMAAAHDYEINLKAEIEIMALHEKMDQMRSQQLEGLIARQQAHIDRLTGLLLAAVPSAPQPDRATPGAGGGP